MSLHVVTLVILALILQGDFYTGSVLASTLAKLVLRYQEITSDLKSANTLRAEVRELLSSSREGH